MYADKERITMPEECTDTDAIVDEINKIRQQLETEHQLRMEVQYELGLCRRASAQHVETADRLLELVKAQRDLIIDMKGELEKGEDNGKRAIY